MIEVVRMPLVRPAESVLVVVDTQPGFVDAVQSRAAGSTALTPTAATLWREALMLAEFAACGAALHRLRSAVRELSQSVA